MCLAIPVKVERLLGDGQALVNLAGVKKQISIELLCSVQPGDYVNMHVGYALNKIDPLEAEKTLALFAEQGLLNQALHDNGMLVDT